MYSNWLEIDTGALIDNVGLMRQITGAQVMAVIKANGYGHGAVRVAREAIHGGATWLGVARIEEAQELRQNGVHSPILVLGYTPTEKFLQAIRQQISLAVWQPEQVQAASAAGIETGQEALLHLKIDTGMSRLGVQCDQALHLASQIKAAKQVNFQGVFTHFACADESDRSSVESQAACFERSLGEMDSMGLRPALVHAANSAAALRFPATRYDLVRAGIAIYGLHLSEEYHLPEEFRPVLAWKTVLSQVKRLPPGRGVSYGHTYVTRGNERIGTAPVGYADGYRRVPGNVVLVQGKVVPVVGRVCMDQIMLQLDTVPEAREGDEVVLIGSQEAERISAEGVAQRWGTINYEVVCGLSARVTRVYI